MVKVMVLEGDMVKKTVQFTAASRAVKIPVSSVTESNQSVVDYSTKVDTLPVISLKRTTDEDAWDSAVWAEENDHAVHNAVALYLNTMVGEIEAFIDSDKDEDLENKTYLKAVDYINEEISQTKDDIRSHMLAMVKNRSVIGAGLSVIKPNQNGDIAVIVDIDPRECKFIKNLQTGRLGDGAGKGLDPKNSNKDIAVIQKGRVVIYDSFGTMQETTEQYFYFSNDEIMFFPNKDRGKLIGISAVRRVLRMVEIKVLLQNILALLVKRFGPQIYVQVGNKDMNLLTKDIPDSYLNAKDSDGNQVDMDVAMEAYKADLFAALEASLTDWVNGDNIFQLVEYGIDIKALNPSAGMVDIARYIQLFTNFIKIAILDLDVSGRIDVTSGIMEENVSKDLREKVKPDRVFILELFNEKYTKVKLSNKHKSAVDVVKLRFKPLDRLDEKDQVAIELDKSKTIYNYYKAGVEPPQYLKKMWGMSEMTSPLLSSSEEDMGNKLNGGEKENEEKEERKEGESGPKENEKIKEKIKNRIDKRFENNPAMQKMREEVSKER